MIDRELSRLSLNQATIPAWSLPEAAEACARSGLGWIGVWRDRLAEVGLARGARAVRDSGLRVSGLLRGGFFCAPDPAGRRARLEDNFQAVEEAAELGAAVLVLVCGPASDRDLPSARAQVAEAILELGEHAAGHGVALGIEPLHPMYCGDRSVVVTLDQALALAAASSADRVGVVIDAYHVWWDPALAEQLEAARGRILGLHVCDWLTPPPHHLNGRGLMGDGVIDLRGLRRAVDSAGYAGPIEVEVFNPDLWALSEEEALDLVIRRYREHVLG